jgi:hypothetical protein
MGSMLDLPAALRAAGLRVWVAPDWKTNGHGYSLIKPFGGVLHHTAGWGLRSVYGEPDARPDVPQPRCNLWTPRPGTQPYDIAVICAGRAWQAGTGRMQAYDRMRAGNFSVRTPDAAVLYGRDSDDVDAGWTSEHTLGNEVEWNTGDPWTDRHLDVVATAMRVCADVLGWPGVGCWANHRQLTWRKPDMDYRGDIWTRAANLANPQQEVFMALSDTEQTEVLKAARQINATVGAGQASFEGTVEAILKNTQSIFNNLNGLSAQVRATGDVVGDDEANIVARVDAAKAELQAAIKALPGSPTPPAGA